MNIKQPIPQKRFVYDQIPHEGIDFFFFFFFLFIDTSRHYSIAQKEDSHGLWVKNGVLEILPCYRISSPITNFEYLILYPELMGNLAHVLVQIKSLGHLCMAEITSCHVALHTLNTKIKKIKKE